MAVSTRVARCCTGWPCQRRDGAGAADATGPAGGGQGPAGWQGALARMCPTESTPGGTGCGGGCRKPLGTRCQCGHWAPTCLPGPWWPVAPGLGQPEMGAWGLILGTSPWLLIEGSRGKPGSRASPLTLRGGSGAARTWGLAGLEPPWAQLPAPPNALRPGTGTGKRWWRAGPSRCPGFLHPRAQGSCIPVPGLG